MNAGQEVLGVTNGHMVALGLMSSEGLWWLWAGCHSKGSMIITGIGVTKGLRAWCHQGVRDVIGFMSPKGFNLLLDLVTPKTSC